MPKDKKEQARLRQKARHDRQTAKGMTLRKYWAYDREHTKLTLLLKRLRGEDKQDDE
jgi:hypothetical protein